MPLHAALVSPVMARESASARLLKVTRLAVALFENVEPVPDARAMVKRWTGCEAVKGGTDVWGQNWGASRGEGVIPCSPAAGCTSRCQVDMPAQAHCPSYITGRQETVTVTRSSVSHTVVPCARHVQSAPL